MTQLKYHTEKRSIQKGQIECIDGSINEHFEICSFFAVCLSNIC